MDRNIGKVVDRILAIIPTEEVVVRNLLNHFMRSRIAYAPPESLPNCWAELTFILASNLGEPGDVEWKMDVAAIMRGAK